MKNKKIKHILTIWMAFFLMLGMAYAEEEEKIDPGMSFTYSKLSDGTRVLNARVIAKGEEGLYAVAGHEVDFYHVADTIDLFLGTVKTDEEGFAELHIAKDYKIHVDTSTGYFKFIARTKEDDQYNVAEEELEKMDLIIEMKLHIVDSVKTVEANVFKVNGQGEKEAVTDEDIYFYVTRMFTDLKFADGWLDGGSAIVEFPDKIHGDIDGNITIIARISEHDEYGTVETRQGIGNWALPARVHPQQHADRELWTPIAPMWMIITLIVMLAGVWGHYIYTIVQLILIKKDGKNVA